MADISQYLQDILDAVYGEEVRNSIHDAIKLINDVGEVVLSTGTAVTGPTSSSTGFFTDSLYLNTSTFELWKCVGTDSWTSQGTLKGTPGEPGDDGVGIVSIAKTQTVGLVDTYTITYSDASTSTFLVTNGENGADGNAWYRGTQINGMRTNPTVFANSGIALARPNDFYLNPTEGAIYYCVTGGDAATATWSYDFTMTGGGTAVSVLDDLNDVDIDALTVADNDALVQDNGNWVNMPLSDVAFSGSYTDLDDKPTIPAAQVNADWNASGTVAEILNKPTIPSVNDATLTIQQNGTTKGTFTANSNTDATANIVTDSWTSASVVASDGTVTFSGLDDTQGWGFEPFIYVDGNSVELNPTAQIQTLSGAGTANMSIIYETTADQGASVKLRIIK